MNYRFLKEKKDEYGLYFINISSLGKSGRID